MTKRGRLVFYGGFWEYFFTMIFLLPLSYFSGGLFLPYLIYWNYDFFVSRTGFEIYEEDIKRSIDY